MKEMRHRHSMNKNAVCNELMALYSMLPHIVEHSSQVMNVSPAIMDTSRVHRTNLGAIAFGG